MMQKLAMNIIGSVGFMGASVAVIFVFIHIIGYLIGLGFVGALIFGWALYLTDPLNLRKKWRTKAKKG
jgi:hypothetical protein